MVAQKDVFICHAGSDKEAVARPLAGALRRQGFEVWVDEAEVRWGESLPDKINEGLRRSRFVVVVLSDDFIDRAWPQRELNAALNEEAGSGRVRVLPLIADPDAGERILAHLPLLNDKRYLVWDGTADEAVAELRRWGGSVSREPEADGSAADQPAPEGDVHIPVPKARRSATDRERNRFLQTGFDQILVYFQRGVQKLEYELDGVAGEVEPIHRYKFIARAYLAGQEQCRCKIWRSDLLGSDGIGYIDGSFGLDSDNAYNELLQVVEGESGPGFALQIGSVMHAEDDTGVLSPDQAAAALWRRFIRPLESE